MKLLGKLQKINWGRTIMIRDYDKFECHVNPYGESTSGIPSEDHTEIAEMIVTAVNNYAEVIKSLKECQRELNIHIGNTKTGGYRNHLTEVNIRALSILQNLKTADNE